MTTETIHDTVREHYAAAAVRATQGESCCSGPSTIGASVSVIGRSVVVRARQEVAAAADQLALALVHPGAAIRTREDHRTRVDRREIDLIFIAIDDHELREIDGPRLDHEGTSTCDVGRLSAGTSRA